MNALASQVAAWTQGRLVGRDALLVGVGHDSRTLQPGALYVALRGERVDGHDFVGALSERAGAALVDHPVAADLAQIVVGNTEVALQQLARNWLSTLDLRVVALTGSNGKTTTKELTAAILSRVARTYATPGNYNNEIGVPLTVLGLGADHRFGVIEMGAGKPGDIDTLSAIAPAHAALVTNVAPAHLERMGSVEGVAQVKAGIYRGLRADGVAVINADDPFADYFRSQCGDRRQLDYGVSPAAAVRAEAPQIGVVSRFQLVTPAGNCAIELPLAGRHNVMNALAAAALALAVGAPLAAIAAGLSDAQAVSGRLRRLNVAAGTLYDDSYNANPGSLAAAIDTLALEAMPRALVLGDMAELGPQSAELHARCGALARERGIDQLYATGRLTPGAVAAFGPGARHFEQIEDLIAAVRRDWQPGITVLVKGSRSSRMERVVHALTGTHASHEGNH
jgi:UDP-N-acetylmuramoyl-tripeptide--D-alanyl-D-alanine ligase